MIVKKRREKSSPWYEYHGERRPVKTLRRTWSGFFKNVDRELAVIKSRLKNEFDKNDILKDSNCKFILENKNLKARNSTLEKELEGRIQLWFALL